MLTQDSAQEASSQASLPAQVPASPPGCCRVQGKSNDGDCLVEGDGTKYGRMVWLTSTKK